MSSALDFLMFPPLSLFDKARLAVDDLARVARQGLAPLEQVIPVVDWLSPAVRPPHVRPHLAAAARSKLGENYRFASAAFIWAIIARMYAARRSGLKREMFGYVEGGYDAVLAALRSGAREQRHRDRHRPPGDRRA